MKISLDLEANVGALLSGTGAAEKSLQDISKEAANAKKAMGESFASAGTAGRQVVQTAAQQVNSFGQLIQSYKKLEAAAIAAGGIQTEQGRALIKQAGQLKEEVDKVKEATKNFGSETLGFEAVTEGFRAVAASAELAFGAQALFGDKSAEAEEVMKELLGVMALSNAAQEIYVTLQEKSALRIALSNAAEAIRGFFLKVNTALQTESNAAVAEGTVITEANAVAAEGSAAATGLAGVAVKVLGTIMKVFSVEAATAWAIATLGVSLLVTALAALAISFKSLVKWSEDYAKSIEGINDKYNELILTEEVLRAQQEGLGKSTLKIDLDIATDKFNQAYDLYDKLKQKKEEADKSLFKSFSKEDEDNLNKAIDAINNAGKEIESIRAKQAKGTLDLIDQNILNTQKVEKDGYAQELDVLAESRKQQRAVLLESFSNIEKDEGIQARALELFDEETGKERLAIIKKYAELRKQVLRDEQTFVLNTIKNIEVFQSPEQKIEAERSLAIQALGQANQDLAAKQQDALEKGVITRDLYNSITIEREAFFQKSLSAIDRKAADDRFTLYMDQQDAIDNLQQDGRNKEIALIEDKYARELALAKDNATLITALTEKKERDLAAVDLKYNLANLKATQDHQKNLVDLSFQGNKDDIDNKIYLDEKKLEIDKKYGEAQIELLKAQYAGATSEEKKQIQLSIDAIQQSIKDKTDSLANEKADPKKFSLGKFLGITGGDEAQQQAIDKAIQQTIDSTFSTINDAIDAQIAANDRLVKSIGDRIKAQEDAVKTEADLSKQGLANNLKTEQDRLQALYKQQRDALAQQKKLAKEKAAIETAQQATSLLTGSAELFSSLLPLGPIGIGLAVAATAAMFAAFVAARVKATQLANQGGGFKKGGYTGDGNPWEEAGPVHKREFVHTAEDTKEYRDLFEGIHTKDKTKIYSGVKDLLANTGVTLSDDTLAKNLRIAREENKMQQTRRENSELKEVLKELKGVTERMDKMAGKTKTETIATEKETMIVKGNSTKIIKKAK